MNSSAELAYDTVFEEASDRDRLLLEQLPQVRYIAHRIHERLPRHVPFEDLVNAGVVGLIDALHKYDRGKHVQFSSYAKFRIRGAILDSLREMDWGPRELRRKSREIEDVHSRLATRLGRAPSEAEVAEAMAMTLEDFQHLLGELDGLELGGVRAHTDADGKEEDPIEFVANPNDENPFVICLRGEMKELLARAIAELPEKERQALGLYYFEELTMKEVGAVLGVGESRVSQIHSMAIVRLRARLQQWMSAGAPSAAEAEVDHQEVAWKKS